eukprot:6490597-Amphidinium_carterae.1
MGSRVGLGKARRVAVRYPGLEQLVADGTIKLVEVKGTQRPPDVGTKYLSKQGMIHAKTMLGLMEPESLAAFGYEVSDSVGVRDKLDRSSSMVASIRIAILMSGRELDRCAASFKFVLAAGTAPLRAAATAPAQELVITTSTSYIYSDGDVAGAIESTLLVSIITVIILVCSQLLWSQQQTTTSRKDASTQTDQLSTRECSATRVRSVSTWSAIPQSTRVHSSDKCKIKSTPLHTMQNLWMNLTPL